MRDCQINLGGDCGLCNYYDKNTGCEHDKKGKVKVQVTITLDPETQIFSVDFPDVYADSEFGQLLADNLDEVQPGFGQLAISNTWAKLIHWPEIEDQKEGFGLTLFFE
jgi:hypothetical protein